MTVRIVRRRKSSHQSSVTGERISKVRFKYKFDENYNPLYANGAVGGITSQGEIAMNFFLERQAIPLEETHSLTTDGRIGNVLERLPKAVDGAGTLIRFVSHGVVLSPDSARRVHAFLGRLLETIEQQREAMVQPSSSKPTRARIKVLPSPREKGPQKGAIRIARSLAIARQTDK